MPAVALEILLSSTATFPECVGDVVEIQLANVITTRPLNEISTTVYDKAGRAIAEVNPLECPRT